MSHTSTLVAVTIELQKILDSAIAKFKQAPNPMSESAIEANGCVQVAQHLLKLIDDKNHPSKTFELGSKEHIDQITHDLSQAQLELNALVTQCYIKGNSDALHMGIIAGVHSRIGTLHIELSKAMMVYFHSKHKW